jgi:hypothetical protein
MAAAREIQDLAQLLVTCAGKTRGGSGIQIKVEHSRDAARVSVVSLCNIQYWINSVSLDGIFLQCHRLLDDLKVSRVLFLLLLCHVLLLSAIIFFITVSYFSLSSSYFSLLSIFPLHHKFIISTIIIIPSFHVAIFIYVLLLV